MADFDITRVAARRSLCERSLWCLDLTQMVLAVQKMLKSTHSNILNSFCFNNLAQKSIPVVVLAHGLLLAVFGA